MAFYLASDVHMRSDRPEPPPVRALGAGIENDTSLLIAGDLCDFWMVAREDENDFMKCAGIAALRDFRTRGGSLEILPGNHDLWACPYYERVLGDSGARAVRHDGSWASPSRGSRPSAGCAGSGRA